MTIFFLKITLKVTDNSKLVKNSDNMVTVDIWNPHYPYKNIYKPLLLLSGYINMKI